MGAGRASPGEKAYQVLRRTATQAKSLRLAALAASLKESGHFGMVLHEIDKMIANLKEEEKADFAQKDWCKEETFKNEQEASKFEYAIEKIDAKIAKLRAHIEELEATLADTVQQARLTKLDLRKLTDARTEENKVF